MKPEIKTLELLSELRTLYMEHIEDGQAEEDDGNPEDANLYRQRATGIGIAINAIEKMSGAID